MTTSVRIKYSPEFLQKVKDSVNLVQLVGEHVVLRKSGSNYTGLCPFHSERSPSFSVNEAKQLYHCYGCKAGGDVLTFVMEILGIGFQEALEELSDRGGIPLPEEGKSKDPAEGAHHRAQREKLTLAFKLNRFAAAFYRQRLGGDSSALAYLKSRGVGKNLSQTFYLGAAPNHWESLVNHLISQKAPLDLACELGLIRPSGAGAGLRKGSRQGPGYFDLFRNRVLFPIVNLRGKVAGFGGRILLDHDTPKYLNSLESIAFQKSKLAFGLYQAQKYIREKDEVILVEGYFDVLAMHAAGFKNVVATCGTSLTAGHLQLLRRFCSRIVLLFDGDQAGVMATERAMETGLDQGCVLFGAQMPPNLDPDQVLFDLKTGASRPDGTLQMQSILDGSVALLDSRIDVEILGSEKNLEARTQALKKIGKWLVRLKDPLGREVRLEGIAKRMGISKTLLQDALIVEGAVPLVESSRRSAPRLEGVKQGVKKVKNSPLSKKDTLEFQPLEQALLEGFLSGEKGQSLFLGSQDRLPSGASLLDLFEYKPAQEFMSTFLVDPSALERLNISPKSFLNEGLDEKIRMALTSSILTPGNKMDLEAFQSALSKAIFKLWARFSQRIKQAISGAENGKDIELQARLMKEYLDVQRKMKEFSSFYDEA